MSLLAKDSRNQIVQAMRPGTSQNVSLSGTAAASSAVTEQICRIVSTIDCFYSLEGTATTASTYLPAYTVEYVHTYSGDTFSAITSGSAGTLNITQMV